MATVHKVKMGNRRRKSNRRRYNRNKYFSVGEKVYITFSHTPEGSKFYLCEARIIRRPTFPDGPYKLLLQGIQINKDKDNPSEVRDFLGLRLRRKQDSVFKEGRSFTPDNKSKWIKLSEEESNRLLEQAIAFLENEKLNQESGKNGWLISKRKRN